MTTPDRMQAIWDFIKNDYANRHWQLKQRHRPQIEQTETVQNQDVTRRGARPREWEFDGDQNDDGACTTEVSISFQIQNWNLIKHSQPPEKVDESTRSRRSETVVVPQASGNLEQPWAIKEFLSAQRQMHRQMELAHREMSERITGILETQFLASFGQ